MTTLPKPVKRAEAYVSNAIIHTPAETKADER
jgi:hypothetical protein